jgi:hypothetical protein
MLWAAREESDVMITFRGKVERFFLGCPNGVRVEHVMRRSWSCSRSEMKTHYGNPNVGYYIRGGD